MKLKELFLSSLVAVSLIACGSGDDKAKVDDGKKPVPEKSQECIAAGDKCQLKGDKWVIDGKTDEEKPSKDEPPVGDVAFDYSDIGVTDELKAEKRGFGFWNKGVESPLNAKTFKKNPTQSPTIQWSSSVNYDSDLYNFVAVTVDTQDKNAKNKPKYMFDKIGEENQTENKNFDFFGTDKHTDFGSGESVKIGKTSLKTDKTFEWNTIPALVNTFMYRNNDGGWSVYYSPKSKYFFNQEENKENPLSNAGTGATKLRVYGVNAFLVYDTSKFADLLKSDGTKYDDATDAGKKLYDLSSRSVKPIEHTNFVWYKLSNKGKRIQKTTIKSDGSIEHAVSKYKDNLFPTDVEFDALKYTQFGRLTGEGIDPEADQITGYTDPLLKKYEFTSSKLSTSAGNKKAEDWYFARGTEPTPLATLDNYKAAGKPVVYDGQAVMFGIDYDPRKPSQKTESKDGQSTNAVKPLDTYSKAHTLLDGKQNFVRLTWDPSTGDIKGSVYGVWTEATYWRANKDNKDNSPTVHKGNAPKLEAKDKKVSIKDGSGDEIVLGKFTGDSTADPATLLAAQALLKESALRIEPFINPLVMLSGKVVEGTNSFGGKAVRVKDDSKGLFHGGFFGRDGSEVGGVINSQTGNFKDENLTDPSAKWGGAFGAKNQKGEVPEDLVFSEAAVDYATSTEFFTPGK